MSFPRYPKYKDSGVEWLGEVPEHWPIVSLRYVFENLDFKRVPLAGEDRANVEKIYPYYGASGIIDYVPDFLFDETLILVAEDGANLLSRSTPLAFLATGKFWVNNHAHILKPKSGNDFFWTALLQTYDYTPIVTGAAQPKLTADRLGSIRLPIPPSIEQEVIVAFLDEETAKIDELVAEQRRLIELLKEKRQAVISHAVTKGLNPNVPLRPSGIEWLGDVPEHWAVVALKRIAAVRTGVAKGKDLVGQETVSVPYLRVANVQDGYLKLDEISMIDIPAKDLDRYRLASGDVLMNEGGDFDKLGRGYVWEGQIDPCITQNHVFAVRPHSVDSWWLNSITSSDYAQFYFMSQSKQSTNLASISSTNLMELPVILPSANEQTEILRFVHDTTEQFDGLISEAEGGIELLQERRTALISAAVTGKIDVRGFGQKEHS